MDFIFLSIYSQELSWILFLNKYNKERKIDTIAK